VPLFVLLFFSFPATTHVAPGSLRLFEPIPECVLTLFLPGGTAYVLGRPLLSVLFLSPWTPRDVCLACEIIRCRPFLAGPSRCTLLYRTVPSPPFSLREITPFSLPPRFCDSCLADTEACRGLPCGGSELFRHTFLQKRQGFFSRCLVPIATAGFPTVSACNRRVSAEAEGEGKVCWIWKGKVSFSD